MGMVTSLKCLLNCTPGDLALDREQRYHRRPRQAPRAARREPHWWEIWIYWSGWVDLPRFGLGSQAYWPLLPKQTSKISVNTTQISEQMDWCWYIDVMESLLLNHLNINWPLSWWSTISIVTSLYFVMPPHSYSGVLFEYVALFWADVAVRARSNLRQIGEAKWDEIVGDVSSVQALKQRVVLATWSAANLRYHSRLLQTFKPLTRLPPTISQN